MNGAKRTSLACCVVLAMASVAIGVGEGTPAVVGIFVGASSGAFDGVPPGGAASGDPAPPTVPPRGPPPVPPDKDAPAAPSCIPALETLAKEVEASAADRQWEARFEEAMASLAGAEAQSLKGAASAPSASPLARRLAAVALDRRESPPRHAALDRYRRSAADLAHSEGQQPTSVLSFNRPPPVLAEHRGEVNRLAWEGLLLGAGWWQTAELAAEMLRSLDARPSAEVLGISLVRAVRGFDRSSDQGWRERVIIKLVEILSAIPDKDVLRRFAEADAATADGQVKELLVFVLRRSEKWDPVLAGASSDPAMVKHADFLARASGR